MNDYCAYYQAHIAKQQTLNCVSILKSFDHLCFDRCLDTPSNLFEFFVPPSQEPLFCRLMTYFENQGTVKDLKKLPNRIEEGR